MPGRDQRHPRRRRAEARLDCGSGTRADLEYWTPRAYAAYGQNSFVGKILEIHQEFPVRTHIVLIRQVVGF